MNLLRPAPRRIACFFILAGALPLFAQLVHQQVEPIVSMRDPSKGPLVTHKKRYDLRLAGADWVDTEVDVVAGEVVQATASGSFTLSDGRVVGPAGLMRGWKDMLRQFPLNSAPAGALIGRVSDLQASVPFLVGTDAQVVMPTSGRLYLRVNADADLAGTGRYQVKLTFAGTSERTSAQAQKTVTIGELVGSEAFAEIPRRVADQAGNAGDMVNFALAGTETQVKSAFTAAGWVGVDRTVQDAVLHGLLATLGHEAYTAVPMSTLYLFGRPQDLSFARGDPLKVAAERHHLRVWKTTQMIGGMPLWVGSATHDVGFETDQRNGDVTHKIDPKVDDEREFLLKSFDASGSFSSAAYVTPTDPLRTAHTATGGEFFSDGRVLVMMLK